MSYYYDDYDYPRRKDGSAGMAAKIILALIMIVCIFVDVVYLVMLFGPKKIVTDTNIVDQVTLKEGSQEPAIEVNYFQNKAGDGLEMFEIKFTSLLGENRDSTFSQGVQFVGEDETAKINWDFFADKQNIESRISSYGGFWIWDKNQQYVQWGFFQPSENTKSFQYQSANNDFEIPTLATNEIGADTMFKITLDKQIYGMSFKGMDVNAYEGTEPSGKKTINESVLVDTVHKEFNALYIFGYTHEEHYSLAYADLNFFAYQLYNSIQPLIAGTNGGAVFKFADLFNFYKCTDEAQGKYEDQATDGDLFNRQVENYFNIKIQVHANGAKRASDSLFNAIKGDAGFNITGDFEGGTGDYFYGKNVLDVDIYDFEYEFSHETTYTLKLKDDFVTAYLPFANQISLRIVIDLDELGKKNIVFGGFAEDSGLDAFTVLECKTRKTVDGYIQENDFEIKKGGGV